MTTWPLWNHSTTNNHLNDTITIMPGTTNNPFENHTLFHIGEFLRTDGHYILSGIGIPGNLLCFITFIRVKKLTSPTFFMLVISVVDLIHIAQEDLVWYLLDAKLNVSVTELGCKAAVFFGSLVSHISMLTLTMFTLERFLVVCFPTRRMRRRCRLAKCEAGVVIVIILLLCIDISQVFAWHEVVNDNGEFACNIQSNSTDLMKVYTWIDRTLLYIIPLAIMLLCIIGLVIKLMVCECMCGVTSEGSQSDRAKQTAPYTPILITTATVVLMLTAPLAVTTIFSQAFSDAYNSSLDRYYSQSLFQFLYRLNFSIKFVIYIVSGRAFYGLLVSKNCEPFWLTMFKRTPAEPEPVQNSHAGELPYSNGVHKTVTNGVSAKAPLQNNIVTVSMQYASVCFSKPAKKVGLSRMDSNGHGPPVEINILHSDTQF